MKKISILFLSVLLSFTLLSCGDDGKSTSATPPATPADKSTKVCLAASGLIDSIVSSYFSSISSGTFNVTTGTYTMVGTRAGTVGNYTYTMDMTFNNRTFTFTDDQNVDVAVTLTGGCSVVYNKNTTTGIETYTITPKTGDSFVLTYGAGDTNTLTNFNIAYEVSTTTDKITGTATINGIDVSLDFTW